jgi:ABC-2 type transport system permease protein
MNIRGGFALIRHTWLSWMQHRSFFFLLALGWMISPLIYLFMWSTAVGSETIGGLSKGDFIAYYLILIVVNQLTYAQTNWTVGDMIRDGNMSRLLLYPMSPVFNTLATEIAGKVVYMVFVIPLTSLLAFFLKPELSFSLMQAILFIFSLGLAWMLRFFWGYWLALLAFWMTHSQSLLALQDTLIFLLAGQVAPTMLLPDTLQTLAKILPFRYMVAFPVEILTGQVTDSGVLTGFYFQLGWLIVSFTLFRVLWRKGARRYVSVGG